MTVYFRMVRSSYGLETLYIREAYLLNEERLQCLARSRDATSQSGNQVGPSMPPV
ncbi:hypothetical protein PAXRUDRAFT_827043 [Paxillus rubicundulus Ve08.2h10]|uniref:Uncharacterized protein n=1 Tax=Paxillus rubicundulus Ve08.2h10 TaxID=930991 RepID=A0A0D0DYQ8_9AGAM|nr:hypothetical protein PAXRUDRAFT_827043 [Paxillus rubicundulus Ve08.2h10]